MLLYLRKIKKISKKLNYPGKLAHETRVLYSGHWWYLLLLSVLLNSGWCEQKKKKATLETRNCTRDVEVNTRLARERARKRFNSVAGGGRPSTGRRSVRRLRPTVRVLWRHTARPVRRSSARALLAVNSCFFPLIVWVAVVSPPLDQTTPFVLNKTIILLLSQNSQAP